MPGRWIWSGTMAPVSTTSSTSTMQTLPAMAAAGLKLRAVRRNCRLPDLSARCALTSATSGTSQRALWLELQLQFAGQVLALELLVFAHVGRNHLLDLAGFQQLAQAKAIHTCVVGNHGEVLDAGIAQGVDQRFRDATQTETTHSHELAVCNHALEGLSCGGE